MKFSLDLGESRIKEVDYGLVLCSFQLLGTKDLEEESDSAPIIN